MPAGKRAGANTAHHAVEWRWGQPDPVTVGTAGNSGERCRLVSASALSLPAATFGSTDCSGSNITLICPPRRAGVAGALPLWGLCCTPIPAVLQNIARARGPGVPAPAEPY